MSVLCDQLNRPGVTRQRIEGRRGLSREARESLKESRRKNTPQSVPRQFDWDDFVKPLRDAKNGGGGTFVLREFRRVTGHGDDALMLSQIVYWFRRGKDGKKRAQIFQDGHYWVAKTAKEWERELGIPLRRIRRILVRLRTLGFIVTQESGFAGTKTMLHRLNSTAITEAVIKLME